MFLSGCGVVVTPAIPTPVVELVKPLDDYTNNINQGFGDYLGYYGGKYYDGFHSGEDISVVAGTPVYAVTSGRVAKISDLGALGHLIVLEHNKGPFKIPGRNEEIDGQSYHYPSEEVDMVYSVYTHVDPGDLLENDWVETGEKIADIADISAAGLGAHLHFGIRHPDQEPSSNWTMVGDLYNWSQFADGTYNGYYKNLQGMVDAGLRHPSDFLGLASPPITPTMILSLSGKIAFASERDGNFEIYIMNADGSNQTRLTNNPAGDWLPCFSPDGTKIAFRSERDGYAEIYIMNTNGSNQTNITNNPVWNSDPCFSPDGTKIAFTSWRDGNLNWEIYIINIDGSNQTRLTYNGGMDPCFSPDGTKIAFESKREENLNYEIYIINIDGSNQTRLTYNGGMDPCFSPDGTKIAFESLRDGNDEIYIMNVDGSNQTRLTYNLDYYYNARPCFSPDGTKIAFESRHDGNDEIYIMNVDGSNPTNITNNPADDINPSWL